MTRTFLPACVAALFAAGDGHAQEMVELPGEDRPLVAGFAEVYRIGSARAVADWEVLGTVPAAGFDEAGTFISWTPRLACLPSTRTATS